MDAADGGNDPTSRERARVTEGPVYTTRDSNRSSRNNKNENSQANDDLGGVILHTFELALRGVTVQVCTLGASVTQWRVPSARDNNDDDDIVLGYASPLDMYTSGNPSYFGVTVGRVANRIAYGRLRMPRHDTDNDRTTVATRTDEESPSVLPSITTENISLEINNHPHHLHGGKQGFSHKVWRGQIVRQKDATAENEHDDSDANDDDHGTPAVKFSLVSEAGDQGYPGAVACSVMYSLLPLPLDSTSQQSSLSSSSLSTSSTGVSLRVDMTAKLLGDEPSPINLAQHSYFNLSRHDDPQGVLDHTLTLCCDHYTPTDDTSIPTRHVKSLDNDPTMDWRPKDGDRSIRQALEEYALLKEGVDGTVTRTLVANRSASLADAGVSPFGFDHNYVLSSSSSSSSSSGAKDDSGLSVVGFLTHATKQRTLRVRTTAPGVQLYTANYLSAAEEGEAEKALVSHKDGATYLRWQGICLETQAYPNSIDVDEKEHSEFAKGKCTILTPNNRIYSHTVVYDLEYEPPNAMASGPKGFVGTDSEGNAYNSVQSMWQIEGVSAGHTSDWYTRASSYYEANCPETVDGVLGGFANISDLDLDGSRRFVHKLQALREGQWNWACGAAAECGAGIGRVTKGLLLSLGVSRCDLIESSPRLLSAAADYVGPDASRCRFYCQGLQDWHPPKQTYSIIWVQWVFCYLTDDDAVHFLRRCGEALVEGGLIFLKENTCSDTDFVLDRDDASVTRSVPYLIHLIFEAGLRVVLQEFQTNFPEEIFPVPMIALEPMRSR